MKLSAVQAAVGPALALLLSASGSEASTAHHRHHLHHLQKKHSQLHGQHGHGHSHADSSAPVIKRGGSCKFPSDDPNVVAVTPHELNAGWAMSPDQECKPGSYCPVACKPGMVMAQWDPDATSYTYPQSMNGGLYCDDDGKVHKPFPDKSVCVEGTGSVKAVNKCGKKLSYCQTVLPGNEAMLIPTLVNSDAVLAVPDPSYWCSTAAHYYINPPGTGEEGCIWGTDSNPIGNWSPYVAGANTDSNGQTFVKVGWNPIYMNSALTGNSPSFGVKIECPDGGCNGTPCAINPKKGLGLVDSLLSADGAGGAAFCVVTVPKGSQAHIVTFDADGESDDDDDDSGSAAHAGMQLQKEPESTTSEKTTSKSTPSSTSTSTTPSSTTTTSMTPTSTTTSSSSSSSSSTSSEPDFMPGIFHENSTSTTTNASSSHHSTTTITHHPSSSSVGSTTQSAPPSTTSDKSEAGRQQGNAALAGLVVAFIATAYFF